MKQEGSFRRKGFSVSVGLYIRSQFICFAVKRSLQKGRFDASREFFLQYKQVG